jgi:hypothetical protein
MAIKLTSKLNTAPVSASYPFGNIKDRVGATPGTAVNTINHADFHQFFEKMMDYAGVIHNGLPDNEINTYQLFDAFLKSIAPDPIDITPASGTGICRYTKVRNLVTLEVALTGITGDPIVLLPNDIAPAYGFWISAIDSTHTPVPFEYQSGIKTIVGTAPGEAYFTISYFV